MNKPSAVISGGSLSGLMIGIVLLELGYSVTIFERATSVESQGAGIVLGRFSKAFFAKYDSTKTTIGVPALRRRFLFQDGTVMAFEPIDLLMTSWDKLYYVLRANFDGLEQPGYLDNPMSKERLTMPARGYHMGCTVVSHAYNEETRKVLVKYTRREEELSIEADLLVCAEGASSTLRTNILPHVRRTYSGYLAFRGLVAEKELSEEAVAALVQSLTFIHATNTQFLCYAIPGKDGSVRKGERQMNFVWYNNFLQGTQALEKVMTDTNGNRRVNSVSAGQVPQEVIEQEILPRGRAFLPPVCLEVLEKTSQPFIQLVTDAIASGAVFSGGHVILVGDALCGVRPHTTASTNQAAEHALTLHQALITNPDLSSLSENWQSGRMEYAQSLYDVGIKIGHLSQFEVHPMSVHLDVQGDRVLDENLKVGEPK